MDLLPASFCSGRHSGTVARESPGTDALDDRAHRRQRMFCRLIPEPFVDRHTERLADLLVHPTERCEQRFVAITDFTPSRCG